MTGSLAAALVARDNDYLELRAEFGSRTGLGWHVPTPPTAAADTRLSVVIPARNTAHSLVSVLDAVTDQRTSGSVEVIVIDDASTDNTPAIAGEHPAVDVAYRLSHQVGAATARNLGTHLAQAATVVYLDADMVLPGHVLADIAARAHPELVLVGFRQNITYRDAGQLRAQIPDAEPDLEADHRVRWSAPAGVPMFYSGQVYPQPFTGRPLDHTHEFLDLGHGATYYDWDLPRMVVTALVAVPRPAVLDGGGLRRRVRRAWLGHRRHPPGRGAHRGRVQGRSAAAGARLPHRPARRRRAVAVQVRHCGPTHRPLPAAPQGTCPDWPGR